MSLEVYFVGFYFWLYYYEMVRGIYKFFYMVMEGYFIVGLFLIL